jgi:predicted ATPase/DNA-binding SARP family transcriptional activator
LIARPAGSGEEWIVNSSRARAGAPLKFCVLGPVGVVVDGHRVVLGATREAALLADLLVHAGQVVPAERLVDDLWRGDPSPGAAATLQTYVKNLRRVIEPCRPAGQPPGVLVTCRPGYLLHVEEVDLDATRFERLVEEGRRTRDTGSPGRGGDILREALGLWHGTAYGALADETFVQADAARLEELRLVAIEERVEADLGVGRHHQLCGELEALVHEHPYRERLWGQWMLALYRSGRQADALRAYQQVRRLLVDELGIDPGAALRELEDAILLQKPELDWTPPAQPTADESSFMIEVAGLQRRPEFANAFVGRDRERAHLINLLQPPAAVPVTTVTGAGGIGKTRLALHAAAAVAGGYPDGAWYVELASVEEPEAVADVVLTRLGGSRRAGRSPLASLAGFARERRMLVVLDNCEHVTPAAAGCVEAIVGGDSVVLATSREPLSLAGERVVPLAPLAEDAAVALFVDRAGSVDPSFDLDHQNADAVTEICRQLDGLPLAIELAAARVRSMTVGEIARHLDARFRLLRAGRTAEHRHRTLHAAVQWSYDLLDDRLRLVFDALSVFRGGFTVDAVSAICHDELDHPLDTLAAVDALDALVAKSLLVAHRTGATTRYSLAETFRQFGEAMLDQRADASILRARHARHFLAVSEDARSRLSTSDALAAITIFNNEWDNLRAAFDWFAANGDADGALRLVVAWYWFMTTRLRFDPLTWTERAIALDGARQHTLWAAAAGATSLLRRTIGDFEGGERLALEALAAEASSGTPPRFEPAFALLCCLYRRDDERAREVLPVVERIAECGGDPLELAHARYMHLLLDVVEGAEGVRDYALRVVRDAESTGNATQLAFAYTGLLAVTSQHDLNAAVGLLELARRWAARANNPRLAGNAALWLAHSPQAKPLDVVRFVRDALEISYDRGYFGNLDLSLGPLVVALSALGRERPAALLLGGLMTMQVNDPTVEADMTAALSGALGDDLPRLFDEGRALTKRKLARLALDEVDIVLAGQAHA